MFFKQLDKKENIHGVSGHTVNPRCNKMSKDLSNSYIIHMLTTRNEVFAINKLLFLLVIFITTCILIKKNQLKLSLKFLK